MRGRSLRRAHLTGGVCGRPRVTGGQGWWVGLEPATGPRGPETGRRTPADPGHPVPTGTRVRRRTGSGSPPGLSAVPRAADPRLGRCRCELGTPAALGVTPGVRLEPPALDRLRQRCHLSMLAGLFERRIQILVILQPAPRLAHSPPGVAGTRCSREVPGLSTRWSAGAPAWDPWVDELAFPGV